MSVPRPSRVADTHDWHYWPSSPVSHQLSDADTFAEDAGHPELEDNSTIAWGLVQCEKHKEYIATTDILEVEGEHVKWRFGIEDDELERVMLNRPDIVQGDSQQRNLYVVFLNTLPATSGWLPGNFTFRPNTLRILQTAGLSGVLLNAIFSPYGEWANMGNQCFTRRNHENGDLSTFEVCYRYICGWGMGKSFIQFLRTRNQTIYFCINYPVQALKKLQQLLTRRPTLALRDFFIDALAVEESLSGLKKDISERRETLIYYEKIYAGEDRESNTATRQLHRLANHWHTLGQDFADQLAQLDFLLRAYEKYMTQLQAARNMWEVDHSHNMSEVFEAFRSSSNNCARWTAVYRERTNIRINLLFNLTAQKETHTSTEIAVSTAKVAEQTQRDSASMITIAAVTMFFLPGTFICAVLSTTFFDYSDEGPKISRKWWVLPASTIPMTAGVFAVWVGWRWWKLKMQRKRLAEMGRKLKEL